MLSRLITAILYPYAKFALRKRDPIVQQAQALHHLLTHAQNTQFGRDYYFKNILAKDDFVKAYQQIVPARKYVDFDDYMKRIIAGDADVLWPGKPSYFVKSSGLTSDASKLIPWTDDHTKLFNRTSFQQFLYHVSQCPGSSLLNGKFLVLTATAHMDDVNGIKTTYMSGLLKYLSPDFSSRYIFPTKKTANETDYEVYVEKAIEETRHQDVRLLSGVPPVLKHFIEKILTATGKKTLRELWPNIQVVSLSGSNPEFYVEDFQRLIGDDNYQLWNIYGASEGGQFAHNHYDDDYRHLYLNMNAGIFYEFIRADQFGSDKAKRYWIADIIEGKHKKPDEAEPDLVFVLSSVQGFWSYVVGDVIKFIDTQKLIIQYVGRLTGSLTKYDERITEYQTDQAFQQANKQFDCQLEHYHGTYSDKGDHIVFYCEFQNAPDDLAAYASTLDQQLRGLNCDYDYARKFLITAAQVESVPANTFFNTIKSQQRLNGHFKVLKLSEATHYAKLLLNDRK